MGGWGAFEGVLLLALVASILRHHALVALRKLDHVVALLKKSKIARVLAACFTIYVFPHTDICVFSYYWICTGTLLDGRFSACVLAALFPETLSDSRCVRDR